MGRAVAVITARGGSKRIPRKNIRDFLGKPIIEYSIRAALEAKVFDVVMVSTEDEEIAQIAKRAGAEVPFLRSGETADDFATTTDVLLEVLETYDRIGQSFDTMCCIYPTAPFVTADKLRRAMEMLKEPETDSVLPVTAFSFPPMRGMYVRQNNVSYCYPEYAKKRSQDIETMYHDCGQFYCINTEIFLREKKLVTDNTKGIIVPEWEVQDIDTLEDWTMAEMKYRIMLEKQTEEELRA